MDINQFYNSASRLAQAIESSGLMPAVKKCRVSLAAGAGESETNRSLADAMLLRASNDYIELSEHFSADDHSITEHFHLHALGSAKYWSGLTEDSASPADRQRELVSLYSRLMFASSHLPRLLSLITDASTAVKQNSRSFVLEIADLKVAAEDAESQIESAADPDRIARVIDGANMIYQGAALLAGGSTASLELASITGKENRTLVFHGQQETATAVRRIIRHLCYVATSAEDSISEDGPEDGSVDKANVEELVEQLPFLTSLDELERIGALPGERIGDIRSSVIAGSIMLLEAGVVLADRDTHHSTVVDEFLSQNAVGTLPGHIDSEVEAHYLDHFEAVRERMLTETETGDADVEQSVADTHAQNPPISGHNNNPSDDLDDLLVDLNRLYKR